MTFYQKICSFIAVVVIALTFAVAFIVWDAPYTKWFGVALGAIVLGEILMAASWIRALGTKDKDFFLAAPALYPWRLYFIFALLMIIPAAWHWKFSFFLLTHIILFVFFAIYRTIFLLAEHNAAMQQIAVENDRAAKWLLKSTAAELRDLILAKFSGDREMSAVAEKIADLGAYAAPGDAGEADGKLLEQMATLKTLLGINCTPDDVENAANALAGAFARRNEKLKK